MCPQGGKRADSPSQFSSGETKKTICFCTVDVKNVYSTNNPALGGQGLSLRQPLPYS